MGRGSKIRMKQIALSIVALLISLVLVPVQKAEGRTVELCYTFSQRISDLRMTFSFNNARIDAAEILAERFSDFNVIFRSSYLEDVNPQSNMSHRVTEFLRQKNCSIFFSLSLAMSTLVNMTEFALTYPNISWVVMVSRVNWQTLPDNIVYFLMDWWTAWYQIGATAGAQSQTCAGFVFEGPDTDGNVHEELGTKVKSLAVYAWWEGMVRHTSNRNFTVVDIKQMKDVALATEMLANRGCDVITGWIQSKEIFNFVVGHGNSEMFTVGTQLNEALFSGDKILTSMYPDITSLIVNVTTEFVRNGSIIHLTIPEFIPAVIADVSPMSSVAALQAASEASAWVAANPHKIFCGAPFAGQTNEDGEINCLALRNMATLPSVRHPDITYLKFWDPLICPAGTYYQYNLTNFNISCVPCLPQMFSSEPGSRQCRPCSAGLLPNQDASACVKIQHQDKMELWLILVIVFVVLAIVALVVAIALLHNVAPKTIVYPQSEHGVYCVIGLDSQLTKLWRRSLMNICDKMTEIISTAANESDVYICSVFGEIHIVVAEKLDQIFSFLHNVQEEMKRTKWSHDILLKVVVHAGDLKFTTKTSANNQIIPKYYGDDYDIVRLMYKHATPGKLWVSAPTISRRNSWYLDIAHEAPPLKMASGQVVNMMQVTSAQSKNWEHQHSVIKYIFDQFFMQRNPDQRVEEEEEDEQSETLQPDESDEMMAYLSLALISDEEFVAASRLAFSTVKRFFYLLPLEEQTAMLTTVCKQLKVPPPVMTNVLTASSKGYRTQMKQVTFQLLHQMEELELLQVVDQLADGARERNKVGNNQSPLNQSEQSAAL